MYKQQIAGLKQSVATLASGDAAANVAKLTVAECEALHQTVQQLETAMKSETDYSGFSPQKIPAYLRGSDADEARAVIVDYERLGVEAQRLKLMYPSPSPANQRSKAEIEQAVAKEIASAKDPYDVFDKYTQQLIDSLENINTANAAKFREAIMARVYWFSNYGTILNKNDDRSYGRLYSVLNLNYQKFSTSVWTGTDVPMCLYEFRVMGRQDDPFFAEMVELLKPYIYTLTEIGAAEYGALNHSGAMQLYNVPQIAAYVASCKATFKESAQKAAGSATAVETASAATATAKSAAAPDVKAGGAAPKGTAAAIAAFSATSSADAKSAAAASGETATAPAKPAEKSAEATAAAAMGMGGK